MAEYDEDNIWGGEEFGEVSRNNIWGLFMNVTEYKLILLFPVYILVWYNQIH